MKLFSCNNTILVRCCCLWLGVSFSMVNLGSSFVAKESSTSLFQLKKRYCDLSLKSVETSSDEILHLKHIDRVFCISDLHTDHVGNIEWLAKRTATPNFLRENDLIVVAGDISHELETLEESFSYLLQKGSSVLFVPGNHEAWLNNTEKEMGNSLDKLDRIYHACEKFGVLTKPVLVGNTEDRTHGLWIAPLESWYDATLSIENLEDLCDDFGKWPWVDFSRCIWPFPAMGGRNKKVPAGLVDFFLEKNIHVLEQVENSITHSDSACSGGIMTVSHFLPNKQCLPDWKDVTSSQFLRDSWLDHGGGGMSAKFAKVAGTELLDNQIRTQINVPSSMRQIHLFGHSHRPKDFVMDNIRYIHNPLGKPREREIHMVNPDVDFQLVWDTKSGEIPNETIIRYWEEKGGGVEALKSRMTRSRKKTRYNKQYRRKSE